MWQLTLCGCLRPAAVTIFKSCPPPASLPYPAGAAAGVASVLVSMPCDVIKTRMDLHPPHCPMGGAAGALCSTKAFFETGRQLVAAGGGPHALFVGVAPRLLQVGSCAIMGHALHRCGWRSGGEGWTVGGVAGMRLLACSGSCLGPAVAAPSLPHNQPSAHPLHPSPSFFADGAQHHGLLDGCGGHPPPDGRPL